MENTTLPPLPLQCPACQGDLIVTRLQCPACGTEVSGAFALSRLARLREPHASLIALFLQERGNMKDMERILGLSYPTVRARLEEALIAAGFEREGTASADETQQAGAELAEREEQRRAILDALERGELAPAEATARLRALKTEGRKQ